MHIERRRQHTVGALLRKFQGRKRLGRLCVLEQLLFRAQPNTRHLSGDSMRKKKERSVRVTVRCSETTRSTYLGIHALFRGDINEVEDAIAARAQTWTQTHASRGDKIVASGCVAPHPKQRTEHASTEQAYARKYGGWRV